MENDEKKITEILTELTADEPKKVCLKGKNCDHKTLTTVCLDYDGNITSSKDPPIKLEL